MKSDVHDIPLEMIGPEVEPELDASFRPYLLVRGHRLRHPTENRLQKDQEWAFLIGYVNGIRASLGHVLPYVPASTKEHITERILIGKAE